MTWVLDSTRIKQTFLRPTSDYGAQAPHLVSGFRRFCVTAVRGFFTFSAVRTALVFVFAFSGTGLFAAFAPPSKDAVKALKIARGKSFSSGVVFVDGKFVEPPYVVERYGNVIRVNRIQVTNPVVDWSEFLKTQTGAVVTKTEAAVESERPQPAPQPAPEPVRQAPARQVQAAVDDDPLADLFDDAPARPVQSARPVTAPAPSPRPVPAAPRVRTTVSFDGEFELNARASALLNRINAMRTEIDRSLRSGCFICFGSSYSRVSGDKGAANRVLRDLPRIMKECSELEPFAAEIRKEGFVYFPPNLVRELFANRVDYLTLQRRWKKVCEEQEYDNLLENAGVSGY